MVSVLFRLFAVSVLQCTDICIHASAKVRDVTGGFQFEGLEREGGLAFERILWFSGLTMKIMVSSVAMRVIITV